MSNYKCPGCGVHEGNYHRQNCPEMVLASDEKMSNDMPDKAFLRYDKNGLKYWTPITKQPYEDSRLYYSVSHVQQLIKEAEQRQRRKCADEYRKQNNKANELHYCNVQAVYEAILNAGGE